jgi:hypothetical protein
MSDIKRIIGFTDEHPRLFLAIALFMVIEFCFIFSLVNYGLSLSMFLTVCLQAILGLACFGGIALALGLGLYYSIKQIIARRAEKNAILEGENDCIPA